MGTEVIRAGEPGAHHLPAKVESQLIGSARLCGIRRLVLFGSRARGMNHARSDVDVAVRGGDTLRFMLEINDALDTLLMFDVVDLADPLASALRSSIRAEGVILMDSTDAFTCALDNLHHVEGISAQTVQDPVIALAACVNLFTTCFEQSWRAMKGVLEEHGYPEAASGSPRQIIQLACKAGLITDGTGWLSMLKARLAAHTYNEDTACAIAERTPEFIMLFEALRTALPGWLTPL